MSRYILVEVESPAECEALVEAINESDKYVTSQVVGIFTKASQLCSCPPWGERHPGEPETSLHGSKYRWWVCVDCRLPKRMATQTLFNLLDGGGMRGGGWKDAQVGRSLAHLSACINVRWVEVEGRVTTFRADVREQAAPDLEIVEGSDQ